MRLSQVLVFLQLLQIVKCDTSQRQFKSLQAPLPSDGFNEALSQPAVTVTDFGGKRILCGIETAGNATFLSQEVLNNASSYLLVVLYNDSNKSLHYDVVDSEVNSILLEAVQLNSAPVEIADCQSSLEACEVECFVHNESSVVVVDNTAARVFPLNVDLMDSEVAEEWSYSLVDGHPNDARSITRGTMAFFTYLDDSTHFTDTKYYIRRSDRNLFPITKIIAAPKELVIFEDGVHRAYLGLTYAHYIGNGGSFLLEDFFDETMFQGGYHEFQDEIFRPAHAIVLTVENAVNGRVRCHKVVSWDRIGSPDIPEEYENDVDGFTNGWIDNPVLIQGWMELTKATNGLTVGTAAVTIQPREGEMYTEYYDLNTCELDLNEVDSISEYPFAKDTFLNQSVDILSTGSFLSITTTEDPPEVLLSMCCYPSPATTIRVATIYGSTGIVTLSENNVLVQWSLLEDAPAESSSVATFSTAQEVSQFAVLGNKVLAIGAYNISMFNAVRAFPTSNISVISLVQFLVNFGILFAICLLCSLVLRNQSGPRTMSKASVRPKVSKKSDDPHYSSDTNTSGYKPLPLTTSAGPPEEIKHGAMGTANPMSMGSTSGPKVKGLSFCNRFMVAIGFKHTLARYAIHDLEDYRPHAIPFELRCGRIDINTRIYKVKVILAIYLIAVALVFSPNVVGGLAPQSSTSSASCSNREEKFEQIRTDILSDRNYSEAYAQVGDLMYTLDDMQRTIDEASPLFPDFPTGAQDDCGAIEVQIRLELQRQIEDDSCTYDGVTFEKPTGELLWQPVARYLIQCLTFIGCFFGIPEAEDVVPLEDASLPSEGVAKRTCPVDVSLMDDLDQLRELVDSYTPLPERSFEEINEEVEQTSSELLQLLSYQVNLAADIYILYVCLCLGMNVPFRIYGSSMNTRVRKAGFTTSQTWFVFIFCLLAYFGPIIYEKLDISKVWLYLYNIHQDICYVQASFLAGVASEITSACRDLDDLASEFAKYNREIRTMNLYAQRYYTCDLVTRASLMDSVFTPFETLANETLFSSFVGLSCEDGDIDLLETEYSVAPEVNVGVTFASIFATIGVLAQILGKIILLNFGMTSAKYADPLAFHGGKVETISSEEYHGPSSAKLVEYIRVRITTTLIMHTFFLTILLFRMLSVISTASSSLSSADSETLTALILLPVLLCVVLFLFFFRRSIFAKVKDLELVEKVKSLKSHSRSSAP